MRGAGSQGSVGGLGSDRMFIVPRVCWGRWRTTTAASAASFRWRAVRRPLRPATLLLLTGISLCDVCSCYGILRAQRTRVL
jgi:hypothetical protein